MDPLLQLLMGLIRSNTNQGGQSYGAPQGTNPLGLDMLQNLFGQMTAARDGSLGGSSIPQEFWNSLFGLFANQNQGTEGTGGTGGTDGTGALPPGTTDLGNGLYVSPQGNYGLTREQLMWQAPQSPAALGAYAPGGARAGLGDFAPGGARNNPAYNNFGQGGPLRPRLAPPPPPPLGPYGGLEAGGVRNNPAYNNFGQGGPLRPLAPAAPPPPAPAPAPKMPVGIPRLPSQRELEDINRGGGTYNPYGPAPAPPPASAPKMPVGVPRLPSQGELENINRGGGTYNPYGPPAPVQTTTQTRKKLPGPKGGLFRY